MPALATRGNPIRARQLGHRSLALDRCQRYLRFERCPGTRDQCRTRGSSAFRLAASRRSTRAGAAPPRENLAAGGRSPISASTSAPARKDVKAVLAAHRASARWEQEFETVTSWFEAGEAVEALLRPLRTRKRRIEVVSAQLLPARRSFRGERCAWMAATLKERAEDRDSTWSNFALVARDLLGKRPLDPIPLATASPQRRWKPSSSADTARPEIR
jgi:hypothetical protein